MEGKTVRGEAMESISERLSSLEDLYFPCALQSNAFNPSEHKAILLDLLSRDVAVFLECFDSKLTFDELQDDYEINWHVKHLKSLMSPTSDELKSRSVTVKNLRRAYMNKLMFDGNYFSDDSMREREPYLHHEYVRKFQDPIGRTVARPGEIWSDTLLRRADEAVLISKIRWEQREEQEKEDDEEESKRRRLGVPEMIGLVMVIETSEKSKRMRMMRRRKKKRMMKTKRKL